MAEVMTPAIATSLPADHLKHLKYLELALEEAKKCIPTPTAFCVGCVISVPGSDISALSSGSEAVDNGPRDVLSTGYSRELPGNTHAEANALAKAYDLPLSTLPSGASIDAMLANADVYTTMEPCSVRLSGLAPCADALVKAKVKRCFIGVGEPADFVQCEGARKLEEAGIQVIWLKGLETECLEVARTGHDSKPV
ncbi:hypothetical protein FRB99_005913 [Tulasnella sp. 403]|nr:hypothetical protein FRB99_005913 [Tulasnella sp. 403]